MRRNRTDYAINRYYSPDTGRFTTHDPLTELDRPERLNQPQGLNLYPYVMGGPTRYTDPDGLEWLYNSTDRNVYWREHASSPLPTAPGSYSEVEDGEIITKDSSGQTYYLADKWSSTFEGAFLPITMPNPNDFDYILPNAREGRPERFEGMPAHARLVRWTHSKNGLFKGLVEFEQYKWTEYLQIRGATIPMPMEGPALAPRTVYAIPKWARYEVLASIYAAVFEFAMSPMAPVRSAEGIETPTSDTWNAARMDHPSVADATDVACTVATAAIGPAPFCETGVISVLKVDGIDVVGALGARYAKAMMDSPLDIPKGWVPRIADSGNGVVFQRPGATGNADMIRVMDPTPQYPNGYARIYNEHGQPVDLAGKPGSKSATHIPR